MLYLFFINKLRPSTLEIAYSCTHFPYLSFIHFKNFTPTEQSKIEFDKTTDSYSHLSCYMYDCVIKMPEVKGHFPTFSSSTINHLWWTNKM